VTSASTITTTPSNRLMLSSLLRADLIVLVKNRRALVMSILLPVLLLFVTNSEKSTAHLGGSFIVIGLCITYGLASTSIMGYAPAVARDREKGVFQRLRVTPAATWMIMGSRLVVQVIANLIIAIVIVFLGGRIHHLHLNVGQYGMVLLISILAGAMFLGIGQALVGLVESAETVNATARILYIGLIFLGIFGQAGSLGPRWDAVARWSPVGTAMSLFAGALHLSAWSSHDTACLLATLGYAVVIGAAGIRWFRWDAR
jgi:ABC-2 type transport system permease protein